MKRSPNRNVPPFHLDAIGLRQKPWGYRAFQYGFAIWAALLFGISLFAHINPFLPLGRWQLAVAALLCAGLLSGVYWLWERFIPVPRHPRRTAALLLTVYGVLLVAFGLLMQVNFSNRNWDFPVVSAKAYEFVMEGTLPSNYFDYYPNNAPLYCVYIGWFALMKCFGVRDMMSSLVVLNCACILLSIWLLYRTAARLWDEKRALLVLCCAFLYPAFLLYAPIAYTDTLSMPFATGAALLWLHARGALAAQENARAIRCAFFAFLMTALGAILKISVAVLAVAFAIDLILAWKGRARWGVLAVLVVCLIVLISAGSALSRTTLPKYDMDPIPYTHWIMMGLHGNGGYWDPDYELTLQYASYEERVAFTKAEIVRRIEEMGPAGLAQHCVEKLSYIFSDGTCYAPSKLDRGPKYVNILHEWIVAGGKYAGFLYYMADALQLCLLALCAWGGFRAAHRGETAATFLRVAWFGLGLFLLIWEARSRYMVNFLPLFLLCAAGGLPLTARSNEDQIAGHANEGAAKPADIPAAEHS